MLGCARLIDADDGRVVTVCGHRSRGGGQRLNGGCAGADADGRPRGTGAPEPRLNRKMRAQSWMLSVDNAHATHPNYADRHDDQHSPRLGDGPVIKINRNQRYATTGEGAARLRVLAERTARWICRSFVMRSDLACGSTIGPITATETGISRQPILASRPWPCIRFGSWPVRADVPPLVALLNAFYRRVA